MEKETEYRYATYGNVLLMVITEKSSPPEYQLTQNGILLTSKNSDEKSVRLSGNAKIGVEVTINKTFLGWKYAMTVNDMKLKLTKITEVDAMKMRQEKRDAEFREAEAFEKSSQKYYPIFKPGDWKGLNFTAHSILIGSVEAPELVIGYGYSLQKSFSFLTIEDLKQKSIQDIHKEALTNIDAYPVEIEMSKAVNQPMVLASGFDFSAEKILSPSFMKKAHELLEAKELLVSIPRRSCIMIINKDSPAEDITRFAELHLAAWSDGSFGNAPIYNGLFKIIDSKINGVLPLG